MQLTCLSICVKLLKGAAETLCTDDRIGNLKILFLHSLEDDEEISRFSDSRVLESLDRFSLFSYGGQPRFKQLVRRLKKSFVPHHRVSQTYFFNPHAFGGIQ